MTKVATIQAYETIDGKQFADAREAAAHEINIELDRLMKDRRFAASPGMGGNWDWEAVKKFVWSSRWILHDMLREAMQCENRPCNPTTVGPRNLRLGDGEDD